MHRFKRWRDALQGAPSEAAVVGVVRDYVASLAPEVIKALPELCQQALSIDTSTDVQGAAVTLLQCELAYSGEPEAGDVLHEIAHTFAVASMRITSLSRSAPNPAS